MTKRMFECSMERTTKVKIALGILLVLLLARWILGFFPEPLEFAPYTGGGEAGELQTVTFGEIKHVMTLTPETGKPTHYYQVRCDDGKIGIVSSANKYKDEAFENPVTFTGMSGVLPSIDTVTPENTEFFYSQIIFADAFLASHGGDKEQAYRAIADMTVLNSDFKVKETPSLAATIVAALAFADFCVMMAMLLKEYAGGKRKSKSKSKSAE